MLKQANTRVLKTLFITALIALNMNIALAASEAQKEKILTDIKASVAKSIQEAVTACRPDQLIADQCKKSSPLRPSKKQAYIENCIDKNILRCVGNKLLADNPVDNNSK